MEKLRDLIYFKKYKENILIIPALDLNSDLKNYAYLKKVEF